MLNAHPMGTLPNGEGKVPMMAFMFYTPNFFYLMTAHFTFPLGCYTSHVSHV